MPERAPSKLKAAGGSRQGVDGEMASSRLKVSSCQFVTDMPAYEKPAQVKVSDVEVLYVSQVVTVMVKVKVGQNRWYSVHSEKSSVTMCLRKFI